MRTALLAALLSLSTLPAQAQNLSAEIAASGLAPTIARLETLPAPTPSDAFALGGLRFLRAIEGGLQTRWASGLTDPTGMIPLLRLPLEDNPAPAPFDPAVIARLFADTATGMASARAALDTLPPDADLAVEIRLADLWFDVNANTTRDPGEDLLDIAGPMILGWRWAGRDPGLPAPEIRFDAADAAWLSAYTHVLEGLCTLVLAYDPTAAITRMTTARAQMAALSGTTGPGDMDQSFGSFADIAYVVIDALDQPPDATRTRAALGHFRAMVADNRRFWAAVATETDNNREWLPNDTQQSALGLTLPPGTGAVWQGVLADLDAVLAGDLLVPHWRVPAGGIDVAKMLQDPAPIDLMGWIQGADALPYLRAGPVITGESWAAFDAMLQGEAMLLALYLN